MAFMHAFASKCHPGKGIAVEHYEGRGNALTPYFSADERRRLKGASVVFDATWPREWEEEAIPIKSLPMISDAKVDKRVLAADIAEKLKREKNR